MSGARTISLTSVDSRATMGRGIEAGAATAYAVARDAPPGFDTMLAVYPDGRGYLWRQLGAAYAERR